MAEQIEEKPVLNIANYGRIGGGLDGKDKIAESVYLTDKDKDTIQQLSGLGLEIIHQPLPSDARQNFLKMMGGK